MDCFPFRKLLDFSEGLLESQEKQALLAHIASGCQRCRADADYLTALITLMRTDRSQTAPAHTLQAVMDLFDKKPPSTSVDFIRRKITAILAFNSFQPPALAGVRNLRGFGKQLLFKADGYDIDLRFNSSDQTDLESLLGQVLQKDTGAGVAGAVVSLSTEGEQILLTATDAFGIFNFRNLPAQRRYDLEVILPDVEILVKEVSSS